MAGRSHSRPSSHVPPRRASSGATLVEVLVVISVLGMLAALLLPAVQSARERSRNMHCANNLRQIGLAAHDHASAHRAFPLTSTNYVAGGHLHPAISPHRYLLESIDAAAFGKIDFQDMTMAQPWLPPFSLSPANQALLALTIPVFRCPSDSGPPGSNNYRANMGPAPGLMPPGPGVWSGEDPANGAGAFVNGQAVPPADFHDGLSTTAFFSERLIGSGPRDAYTPYRDCFASPVPFYRGDEALSACANYAITTPNLYDPYTGFTWLIGGWHQTWYNHLSGPNSRIPDCASGGLSVITSVALFSARSFHPGGVNVLFADGAVKFVADPIDLTVWRAISTRKGKDRVDLP